MPVKKTYSFTGDLKIYETCPRQYQFFREYDFTPSRSAVIFFGLLVHQTIEEIHRIALDGKLDTLDEPRIRELFDRTFRFLCLSDVRPIGDAAREVGLRARCMNYFRQNQDEMRRVIQTEVDVSLEKDGYILAGKVDLLLGGDGKLELLDFKTSPRPKDSPELIAAYERQLCTYAHILERRHGTARGPAAALLDLGAAQGGCADGPALRPEARGGGRPALRRDRAPHPGAGVRGDARRPRRRSARSATCGCSATPKESSPGRRAADGFRLRSHSRGEQERSTAHVGRIGP